jgi:Protein of unknown function (DUF3017)
VTSADRPAPSRSTAPRHHYRPPDAAELIDQPVGESDAVIQGPVPPRPWYLLVAGQWPLFVTLLTVGLGLVVAVTSHWRLGATISGCGLLLGSALRAVVPESVVGLLACRSRWVDTAMTAVMGAGIVVLAWLVDPIGR